MPFSPHTIVVVALLLSRMAGVARGSWYFEVEFVPTERVPGLPEPHVRLGIAQKHGNLQGPCGLDAFSYSWRDVEGSKFHR